MCAEKFERIEAMISPMTYISVFQNMTKYLNNQITAVFYINPVITGTLKNGKEKTTNI